MKTPQTKLSQEIITTSSLLQMEGMYLHENVLRKWNEEFIDEDTGEVVIVERNELILEKGTHLTPECIAVINFHQQTGDISEVKVTNQARTAILSEPYHVSPWCVTLNMLRGGSYKNMKFLLLARTIRQAIDITVDYAEITYSKTNFTVVAAKGFKEHKFLFNNPLIKEEENNNEQSDVIHNYVFYSVWAIIHFGEDKPSQEFPFLVYAKDVEDARLHIFNYLSQSIADNTLQQNINISDVANMCSQISMDIKSASIIKCEKVIPQEWSEAYNPHLSNE